jgi:PAS domain S-box-containing protein
MATTASVEVLHQAVEAFRKREVGYREILDDLPAAIYTTDSEGRITYYNQACVGFSGRTPTLGDDLWCVSWKLYTTEGEPLAHSECPMAVALKEGRSVRGAEAVAERPDGTRINFAPFPTPIFDAAGKMAGAVNMLVDITEQKQAQERLSVMAREVDHRANNLLAVMQGLLHLTKADSVDAYKTALQGRISALARANSLIAEQRWTDVNLTSLVKEEVAAFEEGERVRIKGEPLSITPAAAQSLGMMIHELCTNSIKYGALSADKGEIAISWSMDDAGSLMLVWEEQGGPWVTEPARGGTGSTVIAAAVRQLGGEIFREWRRSGLRCVFLCSASSLTN